MRSSESVLMSCSVEKEKGMALSHAYKARLQGTMLIIPERVD